MPNPFHYVSAVRSADFTDRERELQALTGFMRNGINVILLSPRRYGKSSLALRAVEQLQKEKGGMPLACSLVAGPNKCSPTETTGEP